MSKIPDLGFWKLWNISFGFFGVQIAYALQSANISRIFSTLGADPHDLSYFWILPPLAGIIVQPIIGALSDRTWTRFGRRIPYLFVLRQKHPSSDKTLPDSSRFSNLFAIFATSFRNYSGGTE